MKKFIYSLSFFIALLTFIINVLSGITLLTSITRSVIVFLVMLFVCVITLKIIHWTLMLSQKKSNDESVEIEKK